MLNHHPAIVTEIEEAVVVEKAGLAVAEEEGVIVTPRQTTPEKTLLKTGTKHDTQYSSQSKPG